MTTFADNVTTLLTTYDNCLALLKSFKHRSKPSTSEASGPNATSSVAAQARLRHSIRSDRTRISRVYESRRTQSGSLLEKGDARARSSLRRVLRRLSAALTRVLRTATGSPEPIIDYESLASLSNASRIDAIKAIDGLSRRISDQGATQKRQPSQTRSVKSHSSIKSDASSRASQASSASVLSRGKEKGVKSRKKQKGEKERARDRPKKEKADTKPSAQKAQMLLPDDPRNHTREQRVEEGNERGEAEEVIPPPSPPPPLAQATPRPRSPRARKTQGSSPKRISIASFASDSTKLGEIVRRPGLDTVVDEEFEIRPVYPLRPYAPTVPERKKGFWSRLAGRS